MNILNTGISSATDASGGFAFEFVPDGRYSLEFTAAGYESATVGPIEVITDITQTINVHLVRRIVQLRSTEVRGRIQPPPAGCEIIDRAIIRHSGAGDLIDVLDGLEGVQVNKSGSAGSRAEVRIRGCAPEHVLILIDGQRLNAAGSGEADLGTIPLDAVEKVELYRGGQSARFGPDALGGVINVVTRLTSSENRREFSALQHWGKWKTERYNVGVVNPIAVSGLTSKLSYGYQGTAGDFAYSYAVASRPGIARTYTGVRRNADAHGVSVFASSTYQIGRKMTASFTGHVYEADQGLPGEVSQPDTTARKTDRRLYGNFLLQHDQSDRHRFEVSVGLARQVQEFDNEAADDYSQRYRTRFVNDVVSAQTVSRMHVGAGNEATLGAVWQRDILYHDDFLRPQAAMGRTVRDDVGIFAADRQSITAAWLPWWESATIDFSLRWDNASTRNDVWSALPDRPAGKLTCWSPKAAAALSRGTETRIILRASYGTSFRLPSINALFWKSDVRSQGNPALRPERAEQSDAGIELVFDRGVRISAGTTYFHSYVKDLIVWQPSSPQGIWTPQNLDAARITGHEDHIQIKAFSDRLRLEYRNTITTAKNRTHGTTAFNKFLTYRPHFVTRLACEARVWKLRGAYEIRLVDVRYALDANTKWYDAYRVDNLELGLLAEAGPVACEAQYRAENLRGEDYVLIAHYPMPGREWGFFVSMTYRMK